MNRLLTRIVAMPIAFCLLTNQAEASVLASSFSRPVASTAGGSLFAAQAFAHPVVHVLRFLLPGQKPESKAAWARAEFRLMPRARPWLMFFRTLTLFTALVQVPAWSQNIPDLGPKIKAPARNKNLEKQVSGPFMVSAEKTLALAPNAALPTWGALETWIGSDVHRLDSQFAFDIPPGTSPESLVSLEDRERLWDQILVGILIPNGLFASNPIPRQDFVGRILDVRMTRTPAGAMVPAYRLEVLRGKFDTAQATLRGILIPENYYRGYANEIGNREVDARGKTELRLKPRRSALPPADYLRALYNWTVIYNAPVGRKTVDETFQSILREEGYHWDFINLVQKTTGRMPFSLTSVEWTALFEKLLGPNSWVLRTREEWFSRYGTFPNAPVLWYRSVLELEGKLPAIADSPHPTNTLLAMLAQLGERADEEGESVRWVCRLLSPSLLGAETDDLGQWADFFDREVGDEKSILAMDARLRALIRPLIANDFPTRAGLPLFLWLMAGTGSLFLALLATNDTPPGDPDVGVRIAAPIERRSSGQDGKASFKRDPYLSRWGRKFSSLLKRRGFSSGSDRENPYAQLLLEMRKAMDARDGTEKEGLGLASMMENTRMEPIGHSNDRAYIQLQVTPHALLSAMSLYRLHKSLTSGFLTLDSRAFAKLARLVNKVANIPYFADEGSSYALSMTSLFFDRKLFTLMYLAFAEIPGAEGAKALALGLFLAGAHRDAAGPDEPEDYYAYIPLLKRAYLTLDKQDVPSGIRLATILGLIRLISNLAPLVVGGKEDQIILDKSDKTVEQEQATKQKAAQLLHAIELIIFERLSDIPLWAKEIEDELGKLHLSKDAIRATDPFLLGLSMTFFSYIEPLFAPQMTITIFQLLLSLDTDAMRYLTFLVRQLPNDVDQPFFYDQAHKKKLAGLWSALEEIKSRNSKGFSETSGKGLDEAA